MEEDEFDDAKKERVEKYRLMATIDNGVYQRFNDYCEKNGYDRSKMVELVIKKFMDIKDGGVE
jgi:hypothetical protein